MNEQKDNAVLKAVLPVLDELNNEQVVECILVWENNPFTAEGMKEMLLQRPKKENRELLEKKLYEKHDRYILSYITYLIPYSQNTIKLKGYLQDIVQEVFEEFELTNDETKPDINRSQIEKICLEDELRQSIYDFIEERLVLYFEDEDEDYDDAEIELLMSDIFDTMMIQMLYFEESRLSLEDYKTLLGQYLK